MWSFVGSKLNKKWIWLALDQEDIVLLGKKAEKQATLNASISQ